ncbi:MAG: 23S rRNA (uracil(1939)-C(5))-methyltransferase RlmD [Bacteroidales bacterium]
MPRKERKPFPVFENVLIIDAGAEGKAIARIEDKVIFIPFVVPGDVVDIQVVAKKKSFFEGKAIKLRIPSDKRTEPFCSHFGTCGGCRWQNMKYEDQLFYKQKQIEDNFQRIGKFEFPPLRPIIASENTQYYRNKLEYTFSERRWLTSKDMPMIPGDKGMLSLGFHVPLIFDKILDIDHCYLQPAPSDELRLAAKKYAVDHDLTFYNARTWTGFLRNMIIRNNTSGQVMLIMVFGNNDNEAIKSMLTHLAEKFPQVSSLMYTINTKKNDVISDLEIILYKGEPFLVEQMPSFVRERNPLKFKIGPVSFYQTNPVQAFQLYKTVYDLAEFKGSEIVYDLYTGTGTIANFIAGAVNKVIGIEYISSAIDDARENSVANHIVNTAYFAGDMVKVLNEEFVLENGKPDILITDPPRSGMHDKVIRQLMEIGPEKIIYVSCNPATQARDIALMDEFYQVTVVQPVDMFPHTHHVENVALLIKRPVH